MTELMLSQKRLADSPDMDQRLYNQSSSKLTQLEIERMRTENELLAKERDLYEKRYFDQIKRANKSTSVISDPVIATV